ncbi:MAG: iron ABC transporter permease [Rhizobiaceae bacterium]|nr:iron ABC transporter permease [Rhizobiaceae bacterium]
MAFGVKLGNAKSNWQPNAASRRKTGAGLTSKRLFLGVALAGVIVLIGPPVVGLIFGSVVKYSASTGVVSSGDALIAAYTDGKYYHSLYNSVLLATITATLVTLLGGVIAWLVERTDAPLRRFSQLFALIPILVPSVLFVTGWIMLLGPNNGMLNAVFTEYFGFDRDPFDIYSFSGMVWVSVLQELPLAFLWLRPAFHAMNPELEEAALVAGANGTIVARKITVPLLIPAISAGWLIFFILSLGSLMVPLLIGLPGRMFFFSTEIYLTIYRYPPDLNLANALSLIYLVVSIVGMFVYHRATADSKKFITVTGKAFRPRITRIGKLRWPLAILIGTVLSLGTGLPMLVFLWNAFMQFPQVPSIQSLQYLTLDNFSAALNYGPAVRALTNSVLLGSLAGVITTMIGMLISWIILRFDRPRWLLIILDQMATLPVAMPGLIVGVSFMWVYLFVPFPIYGTLWILLLAYITLFLPYAVRICSAGLSQLHRELEEAAFVSGARWTSVFFRIVVKIMMPSLLSSAIFIALRAFREYSASIFLVTAGTEVFSVIVLDMWEGGNFGLLSAYVTMVVALLGGIAFLLMVLFSRLDRQVLYKI